MSNVQWKINGIFKADAQKVDSEIKGIGKSATPQQVYEYAKGNPDSELHKCFEWDDRVAAEKYRLSQAQKIIQFIVRVPVSKDKPAVREYQITTQRNTYQPTKSFIVNQNEYEELLKRALAELQAFKNKYKTLSELEEVFKAIDEL